MKTEFIVLTAQEKMPASCFGRYGKVAVCEVEAGTIPKMISGRARGMVRIVETWERRFIGKTNRCAFERAYDEALDMVYELSGSGGLS